MAGRVERQAGEWTGNEKMEARGAAKQAEGKVQNAVGKLKDAGKAALKNSDAKEQVNEEEEETAASENARAGRRRVA